MVPTDYRLDHVAARLVERLEGARPTYAGDDARALREFLRISEEHVDAAAGEYAEVAFAEAPEAHHRFLRREIRETLVPRYHRLAMEMNAQEAAGYGMGRLAQPTGRLGLVVVAVLVLWFVLLKLITLPVVWPLVLLDLSLPLWPDIAAFAVRRRYRSALEEMIADMGRIQDQALAYLPREQLAVDDDSPAPSQRAPGHRTTRQSEGPDAP